MLDGTMLLLQILSLVGFVLLLLMVMLLLLMLLLVLLMHVLMLVGGWLQVFVGRGLQLVMRYWCRY
jgi:hypothetical protein